MEHNWKEITEDLYEKIAPLRGEIYSRINEHFDRNKKITDAWVEFDMNDFIYNDPFYGEQKSTAPFRMNFGLWNILEGNNYESILQIENQTFYGDKEDKFGSFSNSLHFTIPKMKFGKLNNDKTIDFEMEYSLTNSDSYAMMNGTIKDHIQRSGKINTVLKLKDLIIDKPNSRSIDKVLNCLNPKYYDPSRMYEATDLNWSRKDFTSYYIPYMDESKSSKQIKSSEESINKDDKASW